MATQTIKTQPTPSNLLAQLKPCSRLTLKQIDELLRNIRSSMTLIDPVDEASSLNNASSNDATSFSIPEHWLRGWLFYVLEQPNSFLLTHPDYELTEQETAKFLHGIEQMQAGTPLAYLTGTQGFWKHDFIVNSHTLIPRPDTEILVTQVLGWIEQRQHSNTLPIASKPTLTTPAKHQLLDLGTGTGCIAISLAYELTLLVNKRHQAVESAEIAEVNKIDSNLDNKIPQWQVTAVDVSTDALQVAQQNIDSNIYSNINNNTDNNDINQRNNVRLLQSSWYDALPMVKQFTVIVSNPPYIDAEDTHLPALQAEPITALVADDKGMADIAHIIKHAPNYLLDGGLLAIEHGYQQASQVRQLLQQYGFIQINSIQDYGGNDRLTMGVCA